MKYIIIFLFFLVIFVIAVTLGTQNNQVVTFNFLIAKSQYKLSTLLGMLFGIGFVLAWLLSGIFYLKMTIKLKLANRSLVKIKEELKKTKENAVNQMMTDKE